MFHFNVFAATATVPDNKIETLGYFSTLKEHFAPFENHSGNHVFHKVTVYIYCDKYLASKSFE